MAAVSKAVKSKGVIGYPVRAFGVGQGEAAASASLLFYDSFTEAGNTGIDSHTPDTDNTGSGWATDAAAPLTDIWVSGGNGYLETSTGFSGKETARVAYGEQNYIAEYGTNNNSEIQAVFRWVNQNNYWLMELDTGASTNDLRFRAWEAGALSLRASASTGVSGTLNKPNWWVADDGSQFTAGYARNAALLTHVSSLHNTSGSFGFGQVGLTYRCSYLTVLLGTTDPAELYDI